MAMSILSSATTSADLSKIGQDTSGFPESQRLYDLPILGKDWAVQSAGAKGRNAPTAVISGSISYNEHNWDDVDMTISGVRQMLRQQEDVSLVERLFAPSIESAIQRVMGRYKIREWAPKWEHNANGSRVGLDWTLTLVELPPAAPTSPPDDDDGIDPNNLPEA